MGLETGTWVNDLVSTNPAVTDQEAQGANHLQLVKKVLQNTFPNASRAFPFPIAIGESSAYSILQADFNKTFVVNTSSGAVSLTLPSLASGDAGWHCTAFKSTSDTNALTLVGTINGATNISTSVQFGSILVFWDGSSFWAVNPIFAIAAGSITSAMLAAGAVNTAAIGANAVTLANLATQAANTILANITGSSAVPTAATLTAILDAIMGSAQGSILYRGSSTWGVLTPGTAGQVLESGGASGNPSWVSGAGRTLLNTLVANNSNFLESTSDIIVGNFPYFELVLLNIICGTGGQNLQLQVRTSAGLQTTGYGNAVGSGSTSIYLGSGSVAGGAPGTCGTLQWSPSSGTTYIAGLIAYVAAATLVQASYWNSGGTLTGFRVSATAGVLTSGSIRIYGVP
jgi:hypothetical protein